MKRERKNLKIRSKQKDMEVLLINKMTSGDKRLKQVSELTLIIVVFSPYISVAHHSLHLLCGITFKYTLISTRTIALYDDLITKKFSTGGTVLLTAKYSTLKKENNIQEKCINENCSEGKNE